MASHPPAKRRRHPALVPLLNQVKTTAEIDPVIGDNSPASSTETSRSKAMGQHEEGSDLFRYFAFVTAIDNYFRDTFSLFPPTVTMKTETLITPNTNFFGVPTIEPLPTQGLSNFDSATLRGYVDPIWRSLRSLDAETMLNLQRTESGARLNDSACVRPIHDDITPHRNEQDVNVVRYLHVNEIPGKYSIGIFVFPPHTRIPLHDHPGMCVLSRVLYGDLERTSMDLVSETRSSWISKFFSSPLQKSQKATMLRKDHLQAPDVTMLFPHEGNLHEFVAGEHGAAVLDVLLPPYTGDMERECTFYEVAEEIGGMYSIVSTGQPEDFRCLSGSYRDLGDV